MSQNQNQDPLDAFVEMTRIASEMISGLYLVAAAKQSQEVADALHTAEEQYLAAAKVVLKQLAESMKDTRSQDQMDKLNKLMEER